MRTVRSQLHLKTYIVVYAVILLLVTVPFAQEFLVKQAFATTPNLTKASVIYQRMEASTATNALILFKGSTNIATVDTLKVTFVGSTIPDGSCTTATSGIPTNVSATGLPGTLACTAASNVVTITGISTLSASTLYGVFIDGITTASAGTYTDTVATYVSSTVAESSDVGVDVISNDQIAVTATVPPTFTLSFGGNSDPFSSSLSPSAVRTTSGITITASTNALNGWTAYASDANAGLTSAHASHTIAAPAYSSSATTTASSGTEKYLMSAAAGTGSPSIDAGYAGNGTTTGGGMSTTAQRVAYGTAATSDQEFTVNEIAAISATTPSGSDYTDTITIVGSGNF